METKMAIEPISSMMTAQMQQVTPATNSTKTAMEYTDVSVPKDTPKVDNTTKVVENTEGKSNQYQDSQPSNEQIHKAVEELNRKMSNSECVFGIHEGTNRVTIKIVDRESKEVIKELPPEKTLDMIARVWEMAGIMVDERR